MPKPRNNESKDNFVSRCIPIVLDDGTAQGQDQAVAVCNSIWSSESQSHHEKKDDESYAERMLKDIGVEEFRPDIRMKLKEHAKSHSPMHLSIIMRELRNGKTWGQARRIAMDRVGK